MMTLWEEVKEMEERMARLYQERGQAENRIEDSGEKIARLEKENDELFAANESLRSQLDEAWASRRDIEDDMEFIKGELGRLYETARVTSEIYKERGVEVAIEEEEREAA